MSMRRYLKIYLTLFRINMGIISAYRVNFINGTIASISWGILLIVSTLLISSKISTVYGWTPYQLLTLTGCYSIVVGLFYTLFSRNFHYLPQTIDRGQLDTILLKPIDSQFLLSLRYINLSSGVRALIAICFTLYMLKLQHISVTFLLVVEFIGVTIAAIILLYSIWYLLSTTMIWFSRLDNLIELLYTLTGMSRFPPEIFRDVSIFVVWLVLPLTFVVAVPAKVLLHTTSLAEIGSLLGFAAGMLICSRLFWRFALRFYTSANG